MSKPAKYAGRNDLLAQLSQQDFSLLDEYLVPVDLPLRKYLETRSRKITTAYFVESGIASVVANGRIGDGVEVGLIGHEGVSGVSVLLGAEKATNDTYMQVAGHGHWITTADLKRCVAKSEAPPTHSAQILL